MHRKKRRAWLRNYSLATIICALVAVLLCVWSTIFSLTSTTDPLRVVSVTLTSPITSFFDRMGAATARAIEAARAGEETYLAWEQEKKELEQKLAAQEEQLSLLQQLQLENEQLRDYLSLTSPDRVLQLLQARTIYTADTTGRLVTLDRGSRDGVEVGMPVLEAGGVIGVVCEVSATTCKVSTLLDETVHIGVRNARSGVSGTLCGAQAGELSCTLKYLDTNLDRNQDLQVGDIIVTGAESDQFPANLTVGRISEVGVDPYDRSPYARVEITAHLRDPSALLMIVTGESPTPAPEKTPDAETPEGDLPEGDLPEGDLPEGNLPEGETDGGDVESPAQGENDGTEELPQDAIEDNENEQEKSSEEIET